jgi:HEAT repeat protein
MDVNSRTQIEQDIAALQEIGGDSYEGLTTILRNSGIDIQQRHTACWLLGALGNKRMATPLLQTLTDKNVELRVAAALALGRLGSKRAVEPLLKAMFTDSHIQVREIATHALGELARELLDEPRILPAVIEVLSNQNEAPEVRGQAAEATTKFLGSSQAIGPLTAALQDAAVEVRFWSTFALGQLAGPAVIPALEKLAASDEEVLQNWWSVGQEATNAIANIRERATGLP